MLILILIDVQYSQRAAFSLEKRKGFQSAKSLHLRFPSPGNKITLSSKIYEYLWNLWSFTAIWKTLISSYYLKVTKFLVKVFQFKFLVKVEKNIFCL